MRKLYSTLLSAFVLGVLAATAGVSDFDGLPLVSAQTDSTSPTVSSVAITSDPDDDGLSYARWYDEGVYGIGDNIELSVTFSENVTVTGSPSLELNVGGTARTVEYDTASTSTVVFSYTVAEGDSDTDGVSIGASKLTLNGGSIEDAADNDANLAHSALSAQSGHKVDGIRPTITGTPYLVSSSFSTDGVHTVREIITAGVHFTEEVIVIGARPVAVMPRLELDIGGTSTYADFGWANPSCNSPSCAVFSPTRGNWRGDSLYFLYTVVRGDLDLDGIAVESNAIDLNGGTIKDAAGNDAHLTHSAVDADSDFVVDGVPPTVSSIAFTSDPGDDDTYRVGDNIEITVTLSEDVGVSGSPELDLDMGGATTTASFVSETSGVMVFRYLVMNGDSDGDGIAIKANSLSANGVIRDTTGDHYFSGNAADLSHEAVADDAEHKVDTSQSLSTDATLSALTLSGISFGSFASSTTTYTAQVAYSVTETTVTPTLNDSGASDVIKLDGVTDTDGVVSLAVGSNVIAVEVTAEDGETTQTYTVTVTRQSEVPIGGL